MLELRKGRNTFEWTAIHQEAFNQLKFALASEPIVQIYDPRKDLTLAADASEKAISAVLAQENHPVLYLSRTLSEAESRYSNVKQEALAIVWATLKARYFLLGRKFKIFSDHCPLEFIFGDEKGLPKVTSARILR